MLELILLPLILFGFGWGMLYWLNSRQWLLALLLIPLVLAVLAFMLTNEIGMGLAAYFLSVLGLGAPYGCLQSSIWGIFLTLDDWEILEIYQHSITDLWRHPQPMMKCKL